MVPHVEQGLLVIPVHIMSPPSEVSSTFMLIYSVKSGLRWLLFFSNCVHVETDDNFVKLVRS